MATGASGHRERPPHIEQARREGRVDDLSRWGIKGNKSPRRKRKRLTDIEREARKQTKAEEKRQGKALLRWYFLLLLEMEDRWRVEINAAVDLHHERSWRAQVRADARRHEKELAYVED